MKGLPVGSWQVYVYKEKNKERNLKSRSGPSQVVQQSQTQVRIDTET